MTAQEVKDALRRRHPAGFDGPMIRQWVCIEEWRNVDLLAIDAWNGAQLVGYEVKVARSDYRRELLAPHKRAEAVEMCTAFYMATPKGLLTASEIDWPEPEWAPEDFEPGRCSNPACMYVHGPPGRYGRSMRGATFKGTESEGASVDLGSYTDTGVHPKGGTYTHHGRVRACCLVCGGRGKASASRVEREAPPLWVPRDVGLIEVNGNGTRVVKAAPRNASAPGLLGPVNGHGPKTQRYVLHQLLRHVSARPDPRHRSR